MNQLTISRSVQLLLVLLSAFILASCAASFGPPVNQARLEQAYKSASESIELAKSLNAPKYAPEDFKEAKNLMEKTFDRLKKSPSNDLLEDFQRASKLARQAALNAAKAQIDELESLRKQLGELQPAYDKIKTKFQALKMKSRTQSDSIAELNRRVRRLREAAKATKKLRRKIRRLKAKLAEAKSKTAKEAVFVKLDATPMFEAGSARFTPEGQALIDTVVPLLKQYDNRMIQVRGHTDALPVTKDSSFESNWELSAQRAINVVKYLVYVKGIRKDRIMATGMAGYHSRASNETEQQRAKNRRVEIFLYPPQSALTVKDPGSLTSKSD